MYICRVREPVLGDVEGKVVPLERNEASVEGHRVQFPAHIRAYCVFLLAFRDAELAVVVVIETDESLISRDEPEKTMIPEPIGERALQAVERICVRFEKDIVFRDADLYLWPRRLHRRIRGAFIPRSTAISKSDSKR